MSKKKPPILANLLTRMLLALFSLPLLTLISTTNVSAAAVHSEPLQQYLALGDSLAFGYQPNGDYTHGYAVDLFHTLNNKQHFGIFFDLGCPGETSSTFINGGICYPSPTSQLASAVAFLKQNANTTGLVTLQIGANDILNTLDPVHCTAQTSRFNTELATLDHNLTQIILPQLHEALKSKGDHQSRLVLVEYYNPFQPLCPNTTPYVQKLNNHLAEDAERYAQTVSIFNSIDKTNASVCQLTWICNPTYHDIHPNSQGYAVIADRIYQTIYENEG